MIIITLSFRSVSHATETNFSWQIPPLKLRLTVSTFIVTVDGRKHNFSLTIHNYMKSEYPVIPTVVFKAIDTPNYIFAHFLGKKK